MVERELYFIYDNRTQVRMQNEYKKLGALLNKREAFIADNPQGGMMEGDKIPATHSRAKMDMRYNEPSKAIEKRKQKRQARRENRRYLKDEFKKEDIYAQTDASAKTN